MPLSVRVVSGIVLVVLFGILIMAIVHSPRKDRPGMALRMSISALAGFLLVFLLTE